jgi:hypothetical protein
VSRVRVLLAATAADITAGGWLISATWKISLLHGLYCAVGTAATVGCDTTPATNPGRAAQVLLMLTAIPLLAAVFGQLHLDKVNEHIETRLHEHHDQISARLDQIQHR